MKGNKIAIAAATDTGRSSYAGEQTTPAAPEQFPDDGFWESGILEEWAKWELCPPDLFLNDEDIIR